MEQGDEPGSLRIGVMIGRKAEKITIKSWEVIWKQVTFFVKKSHPICVKLSHHIFKQCLKGFFQIGTDAGVGARSLNRCTAHCGKPAKTLGGV